MTLLRLRELLDCHQKIQEQNAGFNNSSAAVLQQLSRKMHAMQGIQYVPQMCLTPIFYLAGIIAEPSLHILNIISDL